MKTKQLKTAITLLLGAAVVPLAFAKGPPAAELGNNLSFAAKLVPGGGPALRLPCAETASDPSGPRCTLFPGYWCQKTEAVWQAACTTAAADGSTLVSAGWGANLLGDASIKAGRPIRVEMVLTESGGPTAQGYVVTKLTDELDRLATYGTNGTIQNTNYTVFDAGATLKIETCANASCEVPTGTILPETIFTPEINSLGNIVYGYNWGTKGKKSAPSAGIYKLTFSANGTTLANAPGAQMCSPEDNCTYVIITVSSAAGGGGGGGGQGPRR